MTTSDGIFVIRNQLGQFWTRAGDWVDGREPQRVMKIKHKDEAVNQLVELSSKDIDLRGEIVAADLNDKGEPQIEESEHLTPTLAEKAAAEKAEAARQAALGIDIEAETEAGTETNRQPANEPEAQTGTQANVTAANDDEAAEAPAAQEPKEEASAATG
ncbi:MAG: hypothetical protein AAGG55_14155 [Pseudomonadota bacterium]